MQCHILQSHIVLLTDDIPQGVTYAPTIVVLLPDEVPHGVTYLPSIIVLLTDDGQGGSDIPTNYSSTPD